MPFVRVFRTSEGSPVPILTKGNYAIRSDVASRGSMKKKEDEEECSRGKLNLLNYKHHLSVSSVKTHRKLDLAEKRKINFLLLGIEPATGQMAKQFSTSLLMRCPKPAKWVLEVFLCKEGYCKLRRRIRK